jgi:hypothetical protein
MHFASETLRLFWNCYSSQCVLLVIGVITGSLALRAADEKGTLFYCSGCVASVCLIALIWGKAEWAATVGEFAVAYVIVREMEEGRREKFFERSANMDNYRDRAYIYSEFFDTNADSIPGRSEAFCKRIREAAKTEAFVKTDNADENCRPKDGEKPNLKTSCERQIVLFGNLGQIRRRAWLFGDDYVEIFPHAVVGLWIMFLPYVRVRRDRTGKWWAKDFERLAADCLDFLLKDPKARITIYGRDETAGPPVEIDYSFLSNLKKNWKSSIEQGTPLGTPQVR